jgi:hypothetical protein
LISGRLRRGGRAQPVQVVLVDREPLGELVQANVVFLQIEHATMTAKSNWMRRDRGMPR